MRFTGLSHGIFQLRLLRIDGFVGHMRLDRPFLSLLVKLKFYAEEVAVAFGKIRNS